jgi:NAD(P)-dependent dehydrogenase (short-subunit alcohol dehydrogenase family)
MKTLVITGASAGIGLSTAALFHECGYRVVNISRHRGGFEHGTWIAADLAALGWIEPVSRELVAEIQHASTVAIVHNAALLVQDSIDKSDDADLLQVMQANVIAAIQLNRLLLPYMDIGSAIIYIGSSLSDAAAPKRLSYVVSKHAQIGLMRATAVEIAGRGMHTACICPGITDSEMALQRFRGDNATEQYVLQDALLNRALKSTEIARMVHFCAETPSVNGAVIHANRAPATAG